MPCVICRGGTERVGDVWWCADCEIGQSDHPYDPRLYDPAYTEATVDLEQSPLGKQLAMVQTIALTRRLDRGTRVLDIGCGGGILVERARRAGLNVWGYDPVAGYQESYDLLGIAPYCSQELPGNGQHDARTNIGFEALSFCNSFTLDDNPGGYLDYFRPLLAVLELPILRAADVRGALTTWAYYRPREHLWYFTLFGLARYGRQHGYLISYADHATTGQMGPTDMMRVVLEMAT